VFRIEVFYSQLFVKEEAKSKLTAIDKIIRIFSPRDVRIKRDMTKKISMKNEIPTQEHRRLDKSIF